jgi:hypothetical protein
MASAGTVTVEFQAETVGFTTDIKKIQSSLGGLGDSFKSLTSIAGAALGVFTGGALLSFAKNAAQAADATADAAARAGIAVESFSRLQFAAQQADVDMGAFVTGIQRFQVAISKAGEGSDKAGQALAAFGLKAEDLRNLSIEDQLSRIADEFSRIADPADRTSVAIDLFGKTAGPQLVPLLAQGKDGIAALTAEADRLGITLTSQTAAAIGQTDAAVKQLTSTLSAYAAKFVAGLSVVLLGPPDEIQRIDKEAFKLQERIRQIRGMTGGQDPITILGQPSSHRAAGGRGAPQSHS